MSATVTELDTRGLYCPEPVMMLHAEIRRMQVGDVITVVATDPATERDIPKFCSFLEHDLLEQSVSNGEYRYRVRKRGRDAG